MAQPRLLSRGTYFNGGVRVHDVSNPFRPGEVAYYVPEAPRGSRPGAVQINDVSSTNDGSSTRSIA